MRILLLRLLGAFVLLSVVVLVTFAVWGEGYERWLHPEKTIAWFSDARAYAWLLGLGLLIGDLLLPIPATPVMAALGAVYGPWIGGVVSTVGSMLAGYTGYFAARLGQNRFLHWVAKPEEVAPFHAWFERWGGMAVAVGRSFPVLPEVTTVLAGLAGMSLGRFSLALLIGSCANGFLYAAMGSMDRPVVSFLVAAAIPMLLWLPLMRRWRAPASPAK